MQLTNQRDSVTEDLRDATGLESEDLFEQFNSKNVRTIRRAIGCYPNGSIIKFSSGGLTFVRSQNPGEARNLSVLLLTDENRARLNSSV